MKRNLVRFMRLVEANTIPGWKTRFYDVPRMRPFEEGEIEAKSYDKYMRQR